MKEEISVPRAVLVLLMCFEGCVVLDVVEIPLGDYSCYMTWSNLCPGSIAVECPWRWKTAHGGRVGS
jgi:hypothetical protein